MSLTMPLPNEILALLERNGFALRASRSAPIQTWIRMLNMRDNGWLSQTNPSSGFPTEDRVATRGLRLVVLPAHKPECP